MPGSFHTVSQLGNEFKAIAGEWRGLEILSATEKTLAAMLDEDGTWRGHWLVFEKMPVEFTPENSVVVPICHAPDRAHNVVDTIPDTPNRAHNTVETVFHPKNSPHGSVDTILDTPERPHNAVDTILDTPNRAHNAVDTVFHTPKPAHHTVDPFPDAPNREHHPVSGARRAAERPFSRRNRNSSTTTP